MLLIATMLVLMQAPPDSELVSTRRPALVEPQAAAGPAPSECTRTELPFECVLRLQREGKTPPPPAASRPATPAFDWAGRSACRPGEAVEACAARKAAEKAYADAAAEAFMNTSGAPGSARSRACQTGEAPDACERRKANEAAIARAEAARAEADAPPPPAAAQPSRCRRIEEGERGSANYASSIICGDDDSVLDTLRRTMDEQARRVNGQP